MIFILRKVNVKFFGRKRVIPVSKDYIQIDVLGKFWSEMSSLFPDDFLFGLGTNWTQDTFDYYIGKIDQNLPGASEVIELPDTDWHEFSCKLDNQAIEQMYREIYKQGSLDYEIESMKDGVFMTKVHFLAEQSNDEKESDSAQKEQFTIIKMTLADIDEATVMRLQSWLDTYVSEEHSVTREWIEARNKVQMSPENKAARKQRFTQNGEIGWVAKNDDSEIIGSTTPYLDENGVQHVGSMYVNKAYHGLGVGSALMKKVIEWADPEKPIELGVVTYNERAKAFYRKWGFEEIPGSEMLFADKIPEVKMIRKAES